MNARATLGITAAGVITFVAVLAGQGHTFAQEPTASPAAAATPAADSPDGGMSGPVTMDAADMGAMMGEAMGHMMGAMMSMGGVRWDLRDGGAHDWDHASHGMMSPADGDPHQACLDLMREMGTMMASMMSGSPGMDMGGGMPMNGSSPAPEATPDGSAPIDPTDHAAHHPAPSASPAA